ncbi:hypothetical protein BSKO_06120 [Bryopsis sp. KO-2023]|nr:hypothetical protein BSKO_06120 [Bryopsis sp. KO-2023]
MQASTTTSRTTVSFARAPLVGPRTSSVKSCGRQFSKVARVFTTPRKNIGCGAAAPRTPTVCSAATQALVTELQQHFGIDDHVKIVEGKGGLPKVVLKHSCGSSAEIYLWGACITSWKQANGSEVLYVRPDAKFDKTKAISGGVPICFPQFGPGELPQHGFARDSDWVIASTSADLQADERDPEVEFILSDTPATRQIYPYSFKVAYSVSLHGEQLKTEYRVINTGEIDMSFTGALHTYYEVTHVEKAKVNGLKGLEVLDKVPDPDNPEKSVMEDENLEFHGPVDSVFLDAPGFVQLDVGGNGAGIAMTFDGWKDVVCWTPWKTMPKCYEEFVCVENAAFNPIAIPKGESWLGTTTFQVVDLDV